MQTSLDTTLPVAGNEGTPEFLGRESLGKEDFLELLVAQLNNQDPLDPMDNGAFVAQLAQFASLEELILIRQSTENQLELLSQLAPDPEEGTLDETIPETFFKEV